MLVEREANLLSKIGPPDDNGCWPWLGTVTVWGYGQFRCGKRRNVRAHRFVWEYCYGFNIPEGLVIDHLCMNKLCVNPMHMEVVTSQENTRRARLAYGA